MRQSGTDLPDDIAEVVLQVCHGDADDDPPMAFEPGVTAGVDQLLLRGAVVLAVILQGDPDAAIARSAG
ncbi:hypothetical protein GCM10009670_14880 [Citricoccus alkalitolerans]